MVSILVWACSFDYRLAKVMPSPPPLASLSFAFSLASLLRRPSISLRSLVMMSTLPKSWWVSRGLRVYGRICACVWMCDDTSDRTGRVDKRECVGEDVCLT